MKVIKIEFEQMDNAGCNNGNYPEYTVSFDDGTGYTGITCRCGRGCHGLDRIPEINQVFMNISDFWDFASPDEEEEW